MPKQKTHRASAKRFKRTGSGGLKRFRAYTSHRFHGKTKKQRRHLRKAAMVHSGDFKRIKAIKWHVLKVALFLVNAVNVF